MSGKDPPRPSHARNRQEQFMKICVGCCNHMNDPDNYMHSSRYDPDEDDDDDGDEDDDDDDDKDEDEDDEDVAEGAPYRRVTLKQALRSSSFRERLSDVLAMSAAQRKVDVKPYR
ncbi:hypothetical protein AK812_SmicGene3015 [Symbiodinium microadriaticum]|uniref:Uncharacterized protein n=1 Tax=Symbiodinium microadriaticum TaxID=2951 RepID=A0A1Q9F041_SYMMI|nr:hypothetical protein AK812_SmicGene3015 [Symbiodinium microadriaticum]